MLKQKGFTHFLENMVVTGQVASPSQLDVIDQFDEEQLAMELQKCDHIFRAQNLFEQKSIILDV